MLAAAIVQDLLTVAAGDHREPVPTLVVVDEFRPCSRGRGQLVRPRTLRWPRPLLGVQELADLRPPDIPSCADLVLGNVTTLIAHRQVRRRVSTTPHRCRRGGAAFPGRRIRGERGYGLMRPHGETRQRR
jgi:hypothetical protein